MTQMADPRDTSRPQYPPPHQDYSSYGPPDAQRSPGAQAPPARDETRSSYPPPPDTSRQGQYPPTTAPYPPPGQWAGQPPGVYPPPHHYYQYPPGQPPQPLQPDAYRLPPPYPHHPYYAPPYHQQPPAPAPRQRTAIACKYCRKRKIRCSGYDSSPDGRCQNCVRFNQTCLFHPVSSQAAFVPASAVWGANAARAPMAGQGEGQGQNGQQAPMLYGAHGQPLGPAGPGGQPQYANYPPPQAYPPQPYAYGPPPAQYPGYPPPHDHQHQAQHPVQHPPPSTMQENQTGTKRGPPDDDPHNENGNTSQSPHPTARPRHGGYEGRTASSGSSYDYQGNPAPTSPATSTMSYQSYPPQSTTFANGNQSGRSNNSPPAGLTPVSAQSYNSPRANTADGKTPPPTQPGSAGSSRNGMKVHEMLGSNNQQPLPEQRGRNDNEMLSKLDGKK